MNRNNTEEVFNNIWRRYLSLEKEIWDLDTKNEHDPSETLSEIIYVLCDIALGLLDDLEYSATLLWNGTILNNYRDNCRIKRNELREISAKVRLLKTK